MLPFVIGGGAIVILAAFLTSVMAVLGQTVAFTSVVFFELFEAISCRSLHKPVFKVGLFKNKWLWVAVVGSIILHLSIMYIPALSNIFKIAQLGWLDWVIVVGTASIGFIYLEVHKFLIREKY